MIQSVIMVDGYTRIFLTCVYERLNELVKLKSIN